MSIKTVLAALVVFLCQTAPVLAGPFEDGKAAFESGDYVTAKRLMHPLAEQGQANAQYYIGMMYAIGKGGRQDYVVALKWFRKAAEQGLAQAQNSLGSMYYNGYGVPHDPVKAHKWLNLAAGGGNEPASKNRGTLSIIMSPAQIAEAHRLARLFKPKKEQARDVLVTVLETADGKKSIHKQMVESQACKAFLTSFAKAQRESAPVNITLGEPKVTGRVLDATCILPNGEIVRP